MKNFYNIILLLLVICLSACSPHVSISMYPGKSYEVVPDGIPIDVYRTTDMIRDNYEKIGEIRIGDTGFTTDCSLDKVTSDAMDKCRQMGGNAIIITKLKEPDEWSTCWRMQADVIRVFIETVKKEEEHTGYDEASLKSVWEKDGMQSMEGIYEQLISDGGTKCKLGLKKVNANEYVAIYLSGMLPQYERFWKEGDLLAKIQGTSASNFYKCKWIKVNKNVSNEFYVIFENCAMKLISENGTSNIYYKLYPEEESYNSSATAFAINNDNYVVTNQHVVSGASSIYVRGVGNDYDKKYKASVVVSDSNNDLAILQIEDAPASAPLPYSIFNDLAEVGESVISLGYPLLSTMGEELKLTSGIISSRTGFQGNVTQYQISAPVQPGNSGGPLFNEDGDVIGIISSKHVGTENVSYAIKASCLVNLIKMSGVAIPLSTNNTVKGLPMPKQVRQMRNFIYIVECEKDAKK